MDNEKSKSRMPNQIKPDKEQIILKYLSAYPTYRSRRIANELNEYGIKISETGVSYVLRRKGLNYRLDRLFYAQENSINLVISKRYL